MNNRATLVVETFLSSGRVLVLNPGPFGLPETLTGAHRGSL